MILQNCLNINNNNYRANFCTFDSRNNNLFPQHYYCQQQILLSFENKTNWKFKFYHSFCLILIFLATNSVAVVVLCFITRWLFGVTVLLLVVAVVVGQMRVRLRAYIWCSINSSGDLDFRFKVQSFKTRGALSHAIWPCFSSMTSKASADSQTVFDTCGLFIYIFTLCN